MAVYQRPSQYLAIFDPSVFDTSDKPLTYGYTPTSVFYNIPSPINAPVINRYTIATPPLTLGVGMFSITYWIEYTASAPLTAYTYQYGLMTTLPSTGDSPSASSVSPTSTIGNGADFISPTAYATSGGGFQTFGTNGIILNNYTGTYNTLYAIFNFKFTTGSINSGGGIFMRATRVG